MPGCHLVIFDMYEQAFYADDQTMGGMGTGGPEHAARKETNRCRYRHGSRRWLAQFDFECGRATTRSRG